jgi:hypothetical protein
MNKPGDKHPQDPTSEEGASDSPTEPTSSAAGDKRSGRIAYDDRGNSVWEWQLETGVYSRDISTQRLKKLDLNDLSIAETASHPRPPGLGPASAKKPGGGFNPYDNSSSAGGNVGASPYNSGGRPTNKPEPAAPRKPTDLKKLEEWMAIRRRVAQNKRDEDEE